MSGAASDPMKDAIRALVAGQDLPESVAFDTLCHVMQGAASDAQIAGLLIALRMKGETTDEVVGAVRAMRHFAAKVDLGDLQGPSGALLDTCGTGGDGASTFNVSTAVAFVCAAAGVRVAKHGNRAISSQVGSADVLERLGVRIDLTPSAVGACIQEVGIGFMFAPSHLSALRHAGPARRSLGVRTLLNLLGPMTNPAGATHQLIGVYDRSRVETVAQVLGRLGSTRALVVHGDDGLDEVSIAAPTHAALLDGGEVTTLTLTPEALGVPRAPLEAIRGGDGQTNAEIVRAVLSGTRRDPCTDIVRLNAGCALWTVGAAATPADGVERATALLASGAPGRTLDALVAASQRLATQEAT